jgi:hypothetical protein
MLIVVGEIYSGRQREYSLIYHVGRFEPQCGYFFKLAADPVASHFVTQDNAQLGIHKGIYLIAEPGVDSTGQARHAASTDDGVRCAADMLSMPGESKVEMGEKPGGIKQLRERWFRITALGAARSQSSHGPQRAAIPHLEDLVIVLVG